MIFSRGTPGAGVERDALESIGRDPSPGSIHRTQGQKCCRSTEIQIKLSESRTALRALLADPPVEAATDEVREEHDTKVTEGQERMDALETEYQTALKAEDVATQRAANLAGAAARVAGGGDMPTMPAEFREFMGIEARCEIDGFFDGVQDIETTGAEREMRQALGVYERGVIPWPMLVAPKRLQEIRQEQRAALAEGAKVRALIGKEFAAKIGEGNDVFLRAAFGSAARRSCRCRTRSSRTCSRRALRRS